ncbi:sulfotransferase 1A1-like [Aphomia sociella]
MAAKNNLPFEIRDVPAEELVEIHENVAGPKINSIRVGDVGYFLPEAYKEDCYKIYNMDVRSDDVFIVTFPKSGTTWTQELIWLLLNNLDYNTAAKQPVSVRFSFIEFPIIFRCPSVKDWLKKMAEDNPKMKQFYDRVACDSFHLDSILNAPSPRFIKSHLPLSLLPHTLLDKAKVVYVARDPRDVAVSFYYHHKFMKINGYKNDFKSFWNLFIKDRIDWTPFGPHIKEAWEKRHHPNLLFLFYEDLSKDLPGVVRKVAQFFNKPVTEEQVSQLCDHLHIDNFRRNKSVNYDFLKDIGLWDKGGQFIRNGKTGGWRDYFDEEMKQQAERWIKENFDGTNIQFSDTKN